MIKSEMEIYNDVCELVKNTPFKDATKLLELDDKLWADVDELKRLLNTYSNPTELKLRLLEMLGLVKIKEGKE